MALRSVVLSDGNITTVALGLHGHCYYPDLPHCCACDRSQRDVALYTCDARIRPGPRKHWQDCGRFVCAAHVVQTSTHQDLCPIHAVHVRER